MLEIKKCPVCGGDVDKVQEDWTGNFQGQSYLVPDLVYYICENCGERIYPREAMKRIEEHSPAYHLAKTA